MPVPDIYKFTIGTAYIVTAADHAEIAAGVAANIKWDKGYKNFKTNIRDHLKQQQRNRCAFCRCRIPIGTNYPNLEHIVSKTDYAQFAFLPSNIVYCCHKCNFSKVKKQTLSIPVAVRATQPYPLTRAGFTIVNPYYDNYEDHLDILDDVIIVTTNNSSKGRITIEAYKLFRVELAEERAYEQKLNTQTVNSRLIVS